jgi:hypothetical protein
MRKSMLVLTLAAVFATLTGGCMPNSEGGISALSPRSYPYIPSILPGQSGSKEIH